MGFGFFKGLDVLDFHGFRMLGSWFFGYSDLRVSLDVGHLAFRILYLGSSFFLGYWFFSELDLDLVFRIGSFSFADTKMEKCNREGKLIRSRRSLARRK